MNSFRAQHLGILPDPPADEAEAASETFERALLGLCIAEAERVFALRCLNARADLVEQVVSALGATVAAVTGGHTAGSVILAQEIARILPEITARRCDAVRQTAAERAETRQ